MRVIAGTARGRPLQAPRGRGTRPTSDRVREAMFSSLAADVPGARVLDLFAGTGALGIEALSRGADSATFVEREPAVVATLKANLASTGLEDRAEVVRSEAATFVGRAAGRRFDVVLCDPPYDESLTTVVDLLRGLEGAGCLSPAAVVAIERDKRDPGLATLDSAALPGLLAVDRQRSYGDTIVVYLRS